MMYNIFKNNIDSSSKMFMHLFLSTATNERNKQKQLIQERM